MKGALGKKELLAVVPLSWSTIDRLEAAGEFLSVGISPTVAVHGLRKKLKNGLMKERPIALRYTQEKSHRLIREFIAR